MKHTVPFELFYVPNTATLDYSKEVRLICWLREEAGNLQTINDSPHTICALYFFKSDMFKYLTYDELSITSKQLTEPLYENHTVLFQSNENQATNKQSYSNS